MAATPGGAARLAGEWVGSYDFPEHGRRGSILVTLRAQGDVARGDVLVLLDDPNARYTAWGGADPWARVPGPTQIFGEVRFTSSEDGRISGSLDSYEEPLCGCTVETRLEGRMQDDRVRGTLYAHTPASEVLTGVWELERAPR